MTDHYGTRSDEIKQKGRKPMRKSDVLAAMRRGAILQATFTHPGIAWTLNGAVVPHNTAAAIIALAEIISCADGLFDDVAPQTYRHIDSPRPHFSQVSN
jgi:hypothetical protein